MEVHPGDLHRWRRELHEHGERAFSRVGKKPAEESRTAELERKIGQQAMEIDFLKRALQHVEEQRLLRAVSNGALSTGRSRKKCRWETRLGIRTMCEVAGVSRAGYYRFLHPDKPALADLELRNEIQKIALEWPSYGSRRIRAELLAQGWDVNRKRIQRLMREDNLLCLAKRKFVPTTDSSHGLRVYPNWPR